jgi:calcium/calmodulin-dependent protein kinase (CaM kinase) II
MTPEEVSLVQLTERLLHSISHQDWATYKELCDPSLTAFEPEACGQLVEGLAFHHWYFQLGGGSRPTQATLCQPKVRIMGNVAVVTYIRLQQRLGSDDRPQTLAFEETRIWQRHEEQWKHVHFHRSAIHLAS